MGFKLNIRIIATLFIWTLFSGCHGFETFRSKIPNSDLVQHPCKIHHTWPGLGHRDPRGGGTRNKFGSDFLAAGRRWTRQLCRKDSDGDGRTNGEELGDPDCVWREGDFTNVTSGISHPGVCDPFGSAGCRKKNKWVSCEMEQFNCTPAKQHYVRKTVVRFPRTKVPGNETSYFCMTYDLPTDRDYHLIATEPLIDNIRVVHHMRLMGCQDEVSPIKSPKRCYMSVEGCNDLLGVWTVGMPGQCMHEEAGFRVGATGFKRILLEIHWNNPGLHTDYYDGSGLRVYYSPRLRPFDAGVLWTGLEGLVIPPGRSRFTLESTVPSECTSRHFKKPIYITNALNHMHYLGISEKVEHLRKGERIQYITNEENYSYDSPVFNTYETPLVIQPGDSLKTTCVYRSTSKQVETRWGMGTQDEMCYSLLVFYPRSAVTSLYLDSWGDYHSCMVDETGMYEGCHVCDFKNQSHPQTKKIYDKVIEHCDYKGEKCQPECEETLSSVLTNPCLKGELGDYLLHEARDDGGPRGGMFVNAIRSCHPETLRHIGMNSGSDVIHFSFGHMTILCVLCIFIDL